MRTKGRGAAGDGVPPEYGERERDDHQRDELPWILVMAHEQELRARAEKAQPDDSQQEAAKGGEDRGRFGLARHRRRPQESPDVRNRVVCAHVTSLRIVGESPGGPSMS